MITNDKVIEIFCATDEFSKKFDNEIVNMPLLGSDGKARRRRSSTMSDFSHRGGSSLRAMSMIGSR